jgi:hypothetical protein
LVVVAVGSLDGADVGDCEATASGGCGWPAIPTSVANTMATRAVTSTKRRDPLIRHMVRVGLGAALRERRRKE